RGSVGVPPSARDPLFFGVVNADDQSAGAQAAPPAVPQAEAPRPARLPAETWRLPASQDDDSQEAELRPPQGGAGAAVERGRSDRLHPRRRPQPPRALDR